MTHSTHIIVRSDDIDTNGHVRGAQYLNYAVHARWTALFEAGLSLEKITAARLGPVDLDDSVKYLRELTLGDEIDVHTRFEFPAPRYVKVIQSAVRRSDGAVTAEVVSTTGLMDLTERKLVNDVAELWSRFLRAPELIGLPEAVG
ncbi:hypothetical protein Ais01nite_21440 [Asanoa ishikariensis]|uniref:Acyl-CoA thioester hydrolase n=1 Tax=Asanoa ishikariensis TaxID=137265 RepID=A0A1H3U809_9ACTN|nr:thioesterase family protein [Asanoa ishikariensis]GIF64109.1 hypothetical protein Ais01nite_21440 [Asanoa ishikariensis]SDZ58572.1 acyl-CoA thioester hydrolase [Asanoa ishikariensis]